MENLPEFDSDEGYLTDEWLEAFRSMELSPRDAARFVVDYFPQAVELLSCAEVEVEDGLDFLGKPVKRVDFWTGGWSGAEDLIAAMLGHFWIKHLHTAWQRGGRFQFEVPTRLLAEPVAEQAAA
jgi:hypothetical protein